MSTPTLDDTVYDTPIGALVEYPGNPRMGNVEKIAESLKTNGQYRPILVRRDTREILAGNHTWKAARELGWKTIKVTYLDGVTDAQAKKIVLADNRLSDVAEYSIPDLTQLLEDLGRDIEGTGYTSYDVSELLKGSKQTPATDPDDAPPAPRLGAPKTQTGDVWLLGPHKLIVGDATKASTYEKLLGSERADLVLTDPPYNVAYEGGTKEGLTIQNDDMGDKQFYKFLKDFYVAAYDHSRPGAPIYVFHADGSGNAFRNAQVDSGWLLKQVLVWVKDRLVLSRQDYNWQHEPILYGWKPGAGHTWVGPFTNTTVLDNQPDFSQWSKDELLDHVLELYDSTTVIRHPRPSRNGEHPTMKPVGLVSKLITNSACEGALVLDPFVGSGTTLIACEHTSRIARVIEFDPRYADVVCRRWEEHTGVIPVRQSDGLEVSFVPEEPDGD